MKKVRNFLKKKKIGISIAFLILVALGGYGTVYAYSHTVPNTDFTKPFNHRYVDGMTCNYSVGLNDNAVGCCETKQHVVGSQYSFAAAQFTSLDGTISKEANSYSGGFTGNVSSGLACGTTQYAKKLMFYADVRNGYSAPLEHSLRVFYE